MKPSGFCGKPACLGKILSVRSGNPTILEVEKPVKEGTCFHESSKKLRVQHRFANPKSKEEVINMRSIAVPKKTKVDTEYCMHIWYAWQKERTYRDEVDSEADKQITPITQMDKEVMKHWLTLFVLEVRKQNGTEYHTTSYCLWHNEVSKAEFNLC